MESGHGFGRRTINCAPSQPCQPCTAQMGPHILMQLLQGYELAQLRSLLHSHQGFSLSFLHSVLPEEIENVILVKVIFPRNPRDQQSQHLLGQVRIESKGLK